MPITLTLPDSTTNNLVGPGILFRVALPSASSNNDNITVTASVGPVGEELAALSAVVQVPSGRTVVDGDFGHNVYRVFSIGETWSSLQHQPYDGERTIIDVVWSSSTGAVISTASFTGFTWDSVAGLQTRQADILNRLQQMQVTPGITPAQTTTLINNTTDILSGITATITTASGDVQTSIAQILSGHTLDTLTLFEVTSGPTGDQVDSDFTDFFYGVIIRCTTIPDFYFPTTPDGAWYRLDLAVCTIYRGTDIEFREGIHTASWMKPRPWQYGSSILNETTIFGVPPGLHIQVNWAPGVEGRVYLMRFP